jgi:hypothetical protein
MKHLKTLIVESSSLRCDGENLRDSANGNGSWYCLPEGKVILKAIAGIGNALLKDTRMN